MTILGSYLRETSGDIFKALILYNSGYKKISSTYGEKIIATNFYRHAKIG